MNRSGYFKRNRSGFTLLELICVLAVSSVILVAGSAILHQSRKMAESMELADEQFLGGTFTMDYIERELQSALDVYAPDEYDIGHYDTVTQRIGFILQLEEDKYVTYYRSGSSLIRHTAKRPDGFQAGLGAQGRNAVTANVKSIGSAIDREKEIMEVTIILENRGRELVLSRIFAIPGRQE